MPRERTLRWGWLGLVLLAAGFLAWRLPRTQLQTSAFDLVPGQARPPAEEDGARALTGLLQKKLFLLVGAPTEDDAVAAAEAAAATLRVVSGVASVLCRVDEARAAQAMDFYEPWRSGLCAAADREALRGDGTALLREAQEGLYLPPGFGSSLGFDKDPFGIYGRWLAQGSGQMGRFGLSQGHLGLEDHGTRYVAVIADLGAPPGRMADILALAGDLRRVAGAARSAGATRVLRAGWEFHELAAVEQEQAELSAIGIISMGLLFVLLLLVLPQWGPRLLAFAPVLVGSLCGAAVVLLFWGKVHLVALVFGSTVVGVAEDYGLYFLSGVYDSGPWDARLRARAALGPSGLALLTSALGYAVLYFLPLPSLRQVAVFAVVGLAMDWAGVLLWYPVLTKGMRVADPPRLDRVEALAGAWPRWGRQRWLAPALAALLLASGLGMARLSVDDNLALLYAHDPGLEAEEAELGRLSGVDGAGEGSFFLVGAESAEALLRREEEALDRLDGAPGAGAWTGVARVLPSQQRQAGDRAALQSALFGPKDLAGRLQHALAAPGLKARMRRSFAVDAPLLLPEAWLGSPVSMPYRHLWRGPMDGVYHGLLVNRAPMDAVASARAQAAVAGMEGVRFVDQVQEIAQLLGRLRRVLSWALAGGALVVLVLLWMAYRKAAWAAALPTALGALAALGTLGWLGLPFNLFALLGLILLLGTGIDFGIYLQATGERRRSSFVAVNLAALTNIAAVGVLAFSTTAAFRSFGLVLAVGAGVAWLTAPCFRSSEMQA